MNIIIWVIIIIFKCLFLFSIFSIIGWILEATYKSITNKNIINPGLLIGFSVPLYGFGGVFLYILCLLLNNINSNYKIIIIFITSTLILTLLEYIIGKIILDKYNIKFWDYSNLKLNYKGIVCLYFSFIWGILSLIFYYFLFPFLNIIIISNSKDIELFLLGIYYGILVIDLLVTINLLNKFKKYLKKLNKIINMEKLKIELSNNSNKILDKIYPYIIINKYINKKISD